MPQSKPGTALITGTSGIGFEVARALHAEGWAIILAGRNRAKGTFARDKILAGPGSGLVDFLPLDLGNLASIKNSSDVLLARGQAINLLINNAAVTAGSKRELTNDGFELQIGTNYLGYFALTGRLLPLLTRSPSRVVSVTSLSAKSGSFDPEDFFMMDHYNPLQAYARSKLALLTFALELQRRSVECGWGILSCAVHPGLSPTDIMKGAIPSEKRREMLNRLYVLIGHSPAKAAAVVAYAAASDKVEGGCQYGPSGLFGTRGSPKRVSIVKAAKDAVAARWLWSTSQNLTGNAFP